MLLIAFAALLTPVALGQDQGPSQEKRDPGEALYGEWEVVEMVYLATPQDFGAGNGGWFLFEPGGFWRSFNQEQRDSDNQNKKLKALTKNRCVIGEREIDIWVKHLSGKEMLLQARYDLKDGKLRIIWRADYGPRPIHFDALQDERLTLFVLKKVK